MNERLAGQAAHKRVKIESKRMNQLVYSFREWLARASLGVARAVASDQQWARILHRVGAPSMLGGLLWLRDHGIDLRGVIDGGACRGDWTRLLRSAYPSARVLMIEPQAEHQSVLQALAASNPGRIEVVHSLIGPEERSNVPFHVLDDGAGGTGSSVLAEVSDVPRHVVEMPMTTLDSLASTLTWPVDLLKLDVQGYEIEALKGARGLLSRVPYVLLEVSTLQYNEGSPLMHEVLSWMREAGYITYDVLDFSRRQGDVLVQVDLLFVRCDSARLGCARDAQQLPEVN